MMTKPILVISAIAIYNAGALTILKAVLKELSKNQYSEYEIKLIVHNQQLLQEELPAHIEIVELNGKRTGWIKRLYYEYIHFYFLSKQWNPYLWFSLHEITPNVKTKKMAVYCHHSHLFARHNIKMFYFEPTILLFKIAFHILNWFTVNKNNFVIVQQDWMRKGFINSYNLPSDKVVLARPNISKIVAKNLLKTKNTLKKKKFIYPVFPRSFKNIEIIGEAVVLLEQEGINDFEVILTSEGNENKYAKYLFKKYNHLKNIKFIGFQPSEKILELYNEVDYLIFPSFIESWGLPISEFKQYDKPIILADLPYARETLGDYDKVLFFDPNDTLQLANILRQLLSNQNISFQSNKLEISGLSSIKNWTALFNKLLSS